MSRTILEIAQEAAEREATAPAPSKLFGVNDRIAKILRGAAKDTMRDYMRVSGWQGLSELHSTWAFELVPRRFAYPLPPDFLRPVPDTLQRNGWSLSLVGPATPLSWGRWLAGIPTGLAPMGWRIKNNMLMITPPPDTHSLVTMEYISRYPVVSEIRDGDYDLTAPPFRAIAPVVPRDGYLKIDDESRLVTTAEDDATYETAPPGYDVGTWGDDLHEILQRINPQSATDPLPEVRRAEFTADTDRAAFDDDYLLSLGMTFRLRRGLGLAYAEAAAEYESEMEMKSATDGGRNTTFEVGGDEYRDSVVPLGNGRWMLS